MFTASRWRSALGAFLCSVPGEFVSRAGSARGPREACQGALE